MWTKIAAVLTLLIIASTAAAIEADTNIRLDPHPDTIGFYNNSTYITCNFTNQETSNVTIKFEKYNTTDNSTDTVTDFGEFAVNQTSHFNITAANYSTVGWYRATMYDIDGDTLCYYEVAVRSNTSTNYEALHGSMRFTDADGIPSVSFIENIAGRAQTWTTDSISLTHSIVLWSYNASYTTAAGGTYAVTSHTNTSGNLTNWVLSHNYTLNQYYRMILYSHDGEVLDTQCAQAVVPTANVVEIIVKDAETNEQILTYTATMMDITKNASDGKAIWTNVTNGEHLITVQADNYQTGTATIYMANSYINETAYLLRYSPYTPPHYVRFKVTSVFGAVYQNVHTGVSYSTASGEAASMNGTTGNDGAVTFLMTPSIPYTLTFTNATQGISKTVTLYPKDSEYYIVVGSTELWSDYEHRKHDNIHIAITNSVINDTHAYINITYLDDLNGTTSLEAYLNQTNLSDPYNQTIIAHHTFTGDLNNTNHSFLISPHAGEAFFIRVHHEHTEFGTFYDSTMRFFGMRVDLGIPTGTYIYICIILTLFVAAMFGGTSTQIGSIVICVMGWLFLVFGWLHPALGWFAELSVTVASIYAVATIITHRSRKAGYT